ncbi:hypothetical protein [Nostoc sp. C117]|uniref:hypothetical protein n=1 Tax=Nostoc sp. C117 TaxID=3349875 RepID=UPI00370D0862
MGRLVLSFDYAQLPQSRSSRSMGRWEQGGQGGQGGQGRHKTPNSARAKRPAIANRTPNAQCQNDN